MNTNKRKISAFTLIELLIVVAIIAILAAIAVPNFIEAQVRAKVSRCRADQRSLATALEAYRVDSNAYPPDPQGLSDEHRGPLYWTDISVLVPLTTPIAYITTIPEDVFHATQLDTSNGIITVLPEGWYFTYTNWDQQDYANTFASETATLAAQGMSYDGSSLTSEGVRVTWCLYSEGPSMGTIASLDKGMNWWPVSGAYDPSNGTVSYGEVGRIGP
jgi:type II secretion system protein G